MCQERSIKCMGVPQFVLKRSFEGDILGGLVDADVNTFSQKIFLQKMYTNYISSNSKFNAGESLP